MEREGKRTRLWRWIVYSLATTSAMALRPAPLPAAGFFGLEDMVAMKMVSNRGYFGHKKPVRTSAYCLSSMNVAVVGFTNFDVG